MIKLNKKQFVDSECAFSDFKKSRIAVLPFPYEGGVSYGKGTAQAPQAVIDASHFVEYYDDVLGAEPYKAGISTLTPPTIGKSPQQMFDAMYANTKKCIDAGKFVVVIGGDHSISSGFFRALAEKYPALGAIQFDAHADLRDTYEGSPLSHASVMARIREMTKHTLQLGIRSLCVEEAQKIKKEKIPVCFMHDFRTGAFNIGKALAKLPKDIFLTIDVDCFDWSVIRSTGTPEPGGFLWQEALDLFRLIFTKKNVVGFDVVELSCPSHDQNSAFAIAKLIYKLIGFKFNT